MHHPTQFEAMTNIRQAEFRREAAVSRATRKVQASAGRSARWLLITLSLAAVALGLALLQGLL
jgi:hypothetical protein